MLAWPADLPAVVREFDWDDDDQRPRLARAATLAPPLAAAAMAALALHTIVL